MTTAVNDTRSAAICQACIDALVEEHTDIAGALVSTVDGFAVASRVTPTVAAERLAAMTSSLVALAEAISHEGQAGECRDVVIDASVGRVLLMDVPQPGHKLLLTVLCHTSATLGQVLWAARHCRRDMSDRLSE
jgi:predicted regulator of Ras-like GTPase activity (Roadblock/LC7/MglB family)